MRIVLFIRANNNVTWRNFKVVNNTPSPSSEPPNYVRPVQVKGAKQRRVVYAPVNACGRTSFPEVIFPAKITDSDAIAGERAARNAEVRV
jgi:hypothetical protein